MSPPSLSSLAKSALFFLPSILAVHADTLLLSRVGQSAVIPSWSVGSSSNVGNDAAKLSAPGLDVSDWYAIGSKGTLMATLLESKFNEEDIFMSNHLDSFQSTFDTALKPPAFYRTELEVSVQEGSHVQLRTHGISSRADIYLNGALVADKNVQAGAYAGSTYDITGKVKNGTNILLVRVYPTDYNRDFALGFVDWNPYPPDNGTGIWRDVEVKMTGSLSFAGTPRVNTRLSRWDGRGSAEVDVHVDVKNLGSSAASGKVVCSVADDRGVQQGSLKEDVKLTAGASRKVSLHLEIKNPKVWYPKQWGSQPLYNVSCNVSLGNVLSDSTPTVRFGVRSVTSTLNRFNDTTFFVNGKPFQVLGAGYTSDIFLRFDETKLRAQFQYVLDMGLNTVRLEGKQEHARLYEIADEMGIMIMAGWECCDKWEGWSYNDEGSGEKWNDADYAIANVSMRHEAELMQHHPSMLAFLVGSDFWPDDRATRIYTDALKALDWEVPIIASASQRGFPDLLGNGGMKMDGPYDWVPPNYWYTDQLGAAFGFGSELGAGVGTPELSSLKRFLSESDLEDLWKRPNKGLYHMSTKVSSFYTRTIYNDALWARFGPPTSLENYVLKAQMMDYEATRAEFEAYAARWTDARPATGMIYWMLNNAWPSLHWNLFDYYLHPGGSYFGTKVGARLQHVAYNYVTRSVYLINRSLSPLGPCTVEAELLDLDGTVLSKTQTTTTLSPNNSTHLFKIKDTDKIKTVALLKLSLKHGKTILSRNVYHLPREQDRLDFDNSTWYHTPVTRYANFTALDDIPPANLTVNAKVTSMKANSVTATVILHNKAKVPAVFVRLNLQYKEEASYLEQPPVVNTGARDVLPVRWSDNYVTLWPGEELEIEVGWADVGAGGVWVEVDGWNVAERRVGVSTKGGT